MRQRLAIAISGLAAAAVLAAGLSVAGFGAASRPPGSDQGADAAVSGAVEEATLEPEVVYVEPAPTPKEVVVTERVTSSGERDRVRQRSRTRATRDDDDAAEHRRERRRERRERDERDERDEHEERERDDD